MKDSGMSWSEAQQAMQEGKRVRHEYFTQEEFFEIKGIDIIAEDGCNMELWYIGEDWQKKGWSIVSDQAA
ncbi:hypothetical protein MXM51_01590 [Pantoea stewartii]|uniref:hypothetical protein n=1 Tax=Pantoea stewartii TaxID=66269 RepID=UPI002DB798AF|nr:hypothetical protein [Pantoea stewartii]MEB6533243.1 hypothetical protein [Pantoea stewartii]